MLNIKTVDAFSISIEAYPRVIVMHGKADGFMKNSVIFDVGGCFRRV